MRILCVTSLTESATANYLVRALRDIGHDLIVYSDVESVNANKIVRPGIVSLKQICLQSNFKPELVLFIEGGSMQIFPTGMGRMNCITAWYGIDTHMDYDKHLKTSRLFDVSYIAQKRYVDMLKADGVEQVFWLPLGFAPELQTNRKLIRCHKISYVGSANKALHHERHELLKAIQAKFGEVYITETSPRNMAKIYASSQIVFNKSINGDINMRYFEAMGAGAILVTDRIEENGVEDLFIVGKHLIEYTCMETLISIISEILSNPEDYRQIGLAAQSHVYKHHTYACRADYLIKKAQVCRKKAYSSKDSELLSILLRMNMLDAILISSEQIFCQNTKGPQRIIYMCSIGVLISLLGLTIRWIRRTYKIIRRSVMNKQ